MSRQQRARRCVATLTAIGLPERTAEALLWEALDQDYFAGLERMELCILLWLDKQIADDPVAQALHEANALLGRVLDRCDALEDALSEVHRAEVHRFGVLPLRSHRSP